MEEDSRKTEDSIEDDQIDEDTSPENDGVQVTQEEQNEWVDYCDENEGSQGKEIEKTQEEMIDSEGECDSDEEYKALARIVRKKEKRKLKRVHKLLDDEKHTDLQEQRTEKGHDEKRVSEEEYDYLAESVWNKDKRASKSACTTSRGEKSQEKKQRKQRETRSSEVEGQGLQSLEVFTDTRATTEDHVVIVTDSDRESDVDYIPDEDSGTDESSESCPSQDSILTQERKDLLIGVVETVGREKLDSGSFLDNKSEEVSWKEKILKFVNEQESQGYRFNTEEESLEDLRQKFKREESDDELFQGIFKGDESDNDDALDEEWQPSDCEPDAQETEEHRQEHIDVETDTLVTEFYTYLVDVDGGYRSTKIAQQYMSQVLSVIRTCKITLTKSDTEKNEYQKVPGFYMLLIPGKDGVKFLKAWLSYAVDKYQPGTVRSYLMSLRLFYKFLSQEDKSIPNVTLDLINARRDLMTSWSSAQKKNVWKRKLEKYDEDFRKLLSSENLHKVCHGNQHVNAVKQLAETSAETNRGDDAEKILSDKSHCEVRDWLMTRLLIDNSGRSGVVANMTISEFKETAFYPGTEEDPARYRVHVKDHKTAGVYGPAVVWIYDNLYLLMDMYIRTVRSQFVTADSKVERVFVSSNGLALTSSQVSTSVSRTFQREGVEVKGKICATTIRKSLATGMHAHMPTEKDHLAALALHKPQTQANYYRVLDKVSEADLGRRAVKNLVSLKTGDVSSTNKNNVTTPALWTVEETDELKQLFKHELETGAISEKEISAKLIGTNLLTTHSLKAAVLKFRRMREELTRDVYPPGEEMTSSEKVQKFFDECETTVPSTSKAMSIPSESSRFWRKFTDEQTRYLLSVTQDLVANNTVKKETVWKRLTKNQRAVELGLISGNENEEEIEKVKQRLTDKVRKEARKRKYSKKK